MLRDDRSAPAARIRPWALPLLLLALALVAAPAAADGPPRATVPEGLPVQLDGVVTDAEWARAAAIPLANGGGRLRVMQFRGTCLMALDSADRWPSGGRLLIYLVKDDRDGGYLADGAVTIEFEPYEHDRRHTTVSRRQGEMTLRLDREVAVRARTAGRGSSAEIAFPWSLLELDKNAKQPASLRMLAWWVRPDRLSGPVTWPEDLDLRSVGRAPPAALANSATWGRLEGIQGVGGPGAFPKSQWKTWADEDDKIALLGQTAHAKAMEVEEERIDIPKVDKEVREALFDNLDALARLEPLTGLDQMARAMGHRALNQFDEAIEIYTHLTTTRHPRAAGLAQYELARTLREANRFTEEAAAWRTLAALPTARMNKTHYEKRADQADEMQRRWKAELAARAEDMKAGPLPLVRIETEHGPIFIRLFHRDLPEVSRHLLGHVKAGTYDGTRFHRVIARYVTQGGDPLSREDCEAAGAGGTEKSVTSDPNPRHRFFRGSVGMAEDIGGRIGSQFFFCTSPQPMLDEKGYVCIGYVEAGMDVVDRIARCDLLIRAQILQDAPRATEGGAGASNEEAEDAKRPPR